MTFDFGAFVVGLFLVLAALDGYSHCRPEAVLLFRRRIAAEAVAAVSILVLFALWGWREAAAGAVLLVVLRAGFYFLYRRSLPYVPPPGGRYGGPATGDHIQNWLNGRRTHFRDLLASRVVPTEAQLGTCRKIRVAQTGDARTKSERIVRSYRKPVWHDRPWLHRLHTTLEKRRELYDTEFAAELDAYERVAKLSKEAEAANLIRQRDAADASNRSFPRRDASRLAILERDIEDLQQTIADREFMQRGMVFRVPTEKRVRRWSVADHEAVRETQAYLAQPLPKLQASFKPRGDDDDDDAPRHPPKLTSCACEFCWGAVAVMLYSRLLRAIREGTKAQIRAAMDALLRALVRINFCYSREQFLVLDVPEDGVKKLLELTTADMAKDARTRKGLKVKLAERQPLLGHSYRAHDYVSSWPKGENKDALTRSKYDELFFRASARPHYLFVVFCTVMVALAGADWSVGVLAGHALAGVLVAFVAQRIYNATCTPRARGLGYGVSNGSACVVIIITLGGGVPMLMLGAPAATLLLGAPAALLLLAEPLVRLLPRLLPGLLLGGPTAGLFLSETLAPLLLPGLLIGVPAAHLFLPEPLARLFRPEPLARLPAPPARLLLAAPPERSALSGTSSSWFLEALKGFASSVAAGLGLVTSAASSLAVGLGLVTSAGVGIAPGASCVLCVVVACAVVVMGSTEHCIDDGVAGAQACDQAEASGVSVWARAVYDLVYSAIAGLGEILYFHVGLAVVVLRFCRWARCVRKEGLLRRILSVDKHGPIPREFYVAQNGDPDTYRTFLDDSSVGIHLQTTKDPQERRDRVYRDMTWYGRAYLFNPASISIMEDDEVAYNNAKQGLNSACWGSLVHQQMDLPPDGRIIYFYDLVPAMLVCTIFTPMKPFVIETLMELRVARAILREAGGFIPDRPDLGEFAAIPDDVFERLFDYVPTKAQLDAPSRLCRIRADRRGPPVKLRVSLENYLRVPLRQGRGDSFFETGTRGVGESDESVDRSLSFATDDAVERIRGWRRDIERALPALLVEHFEQVDEDLRYLLEGTPSDPGGRLAPRDDDDELRDAEEAFRARHLRRLDPRTREGRDHLRALERLRNNEFPEEEAWEAEAEDEVVSDVDDDDDDDADGSWCERLFSLVGRELVILFVAVYVGVQYYLIAFSVDSEPLED